MASRGVMFNTQAEARITSQFQESRGREETIDSFWPFSDGRGRVLAWLASLNLLDLVGGTKWTDLRDEYMT